MHVTTFEHSSVACIGHLPVDEMTGRGRVSSALIIDRHCPPTSLDRIQEETRADFNLVSHSALPMIAMDIAFFPQIFDTVFEAADFQELLRLRLTCRALRVRVDEEWRHLQ